MFLCVSPGTTLKKKKGNSLLLQREQTLISVCGIDNCVPGGDAGRVTHIDRDELGRAETEAAFEQGLAHS